MSKRTKKPPVTPERRLDWLQRNEENGESPPQIARNDGFDVRTVRRHIQTGKQERESREAKFQVLRNAMEAHYADLRKYVEMQSSQIVGGNVKPSPDAEFLEEALRQHLPRSPIWNYLLRLKNLHDNLEDQKRNTRDLIEKTVKGGNRLTVLAESDLNSIIPALVDVLVFQSEQWSQGNPGLNLKDNFFTEPAGEGFKNLRYGIFFILNRVASEKAEKFKPIMGKAIQDLESRLRKSEVYASLEKTKTDIESFRRKLYQELAIIRLKRIVPGHCKYCP
jgi:hypothetical protein